MEGKFTLRDFLVYFITGLYLLLVLLRIYGLKLFAYFNISKADIVSNELLTIFLLLPGLYLLGHFIHGIDLLVYKIGRFLWDNKKERELKNKEIPYLLKFLIFIFNGNRVTGLLNEKEINTTNFWKKVSKLQLMDKFGNAEYWNLMNDLFKGLTLVSGISIILNLVSCYWIDTLISLLLCVVFWNRARHMVINFVSTTCNTYGLIDDSNDDTIEA